MLEEMREQSRPAPHRPHLPGLLKVRTRRCPCPTEPRGQLAAPEGSGPGREKEPKQKMPLKKEDAQGRRVGMDGWEL